MTPVLWLTGPPGLTGVPGVGWELYDQLTRDGVRAGYVDIDQLGVYFPDTAKDPDRYQMKARNLDAVVATFARAGAERVVVSGDAEVPRDLLPHASLTVCWLGPDGGDVAVDPAGLSVPELVARLRALPVDQPSTVDTGRPGPASGPPVVWLCGVTGVGKSTVGRAVYEQIPGAAFVELDQIGFYRPSPVDDPRNHRVKAANLRALWHAYGEAGATRLVVVGPVDSRLDIFVYVDALPGVKMTVCRLHAGREELARRIAARGRGEGPALPGDPLSGQPAEVLDAAARKAAAEADALDAAGIGHARVETDGRTVDEVAALVLGAI